MPRPGVDVEVVDDIELGGPILDTGQLFVVGKTERGPLVGRASSMEEYRTKWGNRTGGSKMYDGVWPFYQEGGANVVVARQIAADAAPATIDWATAFTVDAASGGDWGNGIVVDAVTPAGGASTPGSPIQIKVSDPDGEQVELSPVFSNKDAAITWSQGSNWIRLTSGVDPDLPDPASTATLAGGDDGADPGDDVSDALDMFPYEFGPGQVYAPGMTGQATYEGIGLHCHDNDRCGLIDLPNDDDPAVLKAAREGMNGRDGARQLLALGSWVSYPTDTPPASVIVPFGGVQAGIIARVDKAGDVAAVAAGADGISRRALGLAQLFTNAQRTDMNKDGVNLAREMYGLVRAYGYRTAAGPDLNSNWTFFQESRVVMNMAHEANAAVEEYVFNTIDGLGHIFVRVKNMCTAICQKYWQAGALYGATPELSFRVITDSRVNTVDTIKNGEVHAAIYVKTSKVAEWVAIKIMKVPTEREV